MDRKHSGEERVRDASASLTHFETVAGYKLEHCTYSRGGVVVHSEEMVSLFHLLEENSAEWNHRLRVVLAGVILHHISEGKLHLDVEVTDKLPTKGLPHR